MGKRTGTTILRVIALFILLGLLLNLTPVFKVKSIGRYTNAPFAISSSGWVGLTYNQQTHGGIDICTMRDCPLDRDNLGGAPVYAAYPGKLVRIYDNDFNEVSASSPQANMVVMEHRDIPSVSDNPIYTWYLHMADTHSNTSYVNPKLRKGRWYPQGTFLGYHGDERVQGIGDVVNHLHFQIQNTDRNVYYSNSFPPNYFLGPDLDYRGYLGNMRILANAPGNYALKRAVLAASSMDEAGGFYPWYAIDDNPNTRWSSQPGSWQWIMFDLGSHNSGHYPIDQTVILWENAYARAYGVLAWVGDHWEYVDWTYDGRGGTEEFDFSTRTHRWWAWAGWQQGPYGNYSFWDVQFRGPFRSINLNETKDGSINPAFERDVYVLTADGEQWISVRMFKTSGSDLDTYLEIYRSSENRLTHNDDNHGIGFNSFFSVRLPYNDAYKILAHGWVSSTGNYRIRVESGREAAVGDINRDCAVNTNDLSILENRYGTGDPDADLNLDGIVNSLDASILINNIGMSCSGYLAPGEVLPDKKTAQRMLKSSMTDRAQRDPPTAELIEELEKTLQRKQKEILSR